MEAEPAALDERAASGGESAAPTVLLVDDEDNILAALRRLFKPQGYRILTAPGGVEGLETLGREPVDVIISDMRMPGMDGAAFLERAAQERPDTVRILLTGFADLSLTIAAINKGHIYRYISKPWEDNDLRLTIRHALEQQHSERERRRLETLTRRQNADLKELNATLEDKVRARTAELQEMYDMLELTYKELKRSYVASIPVFAGLVEMHEGETKGHAKRIAEMARQVARELGLDENEAQTIYFAGLLHDIGKLGMPPHLLAVPYLKMNADERRRYERHAAMGEAVLMALEPLQDVARLIRHHHERYDGKGYPDGLEGDAIPLGARVLAAVNDYDGARTGRLTGETQSEAEARGFLRSNRGQRFDPGVTDALIRVLGRKIDAYTFIDELGLGSSDLREGMVLSRDLYNEEGILLLTGGYHLTANVIERIKGFERDEDKRLVVYVRSR